MGVRTDIAVWEDCGRFARDIPWTYWSRRGIRATKVSPDHGNCVFVYSVLGQESAAAVKAVFACARYLPRPVVLVDDFLGRDGMPDFDAVAVAILKSWEGSYGTMLNPG
jgi:hypothetical protein